MASRLGVTALVVAVLLTGLSAQDAPVPSFAVEPQDTEGAAGHSVTIYCAVANLGRHQVFWHVDAAGEPFTLGPNVNAHDSYPRFVIDSSQGGGSFNLRIEDAAAADAGKYSCLVYDPVETDSTVMEASAELVIREAPSHPETGYPKCERDPTSGPHYQNSGVYREGDVLTLTCTTKGGVPLARPTWERVTIDNYVQALEQKVAVSEDVTTATATLSLSVVDHRSFYRCTEGHPTSADRPRRCLTPFSGSEALMDVRFAPVVTLTPGTVSLHHLHTEKVTLSCTAEANPPLTARPVIVLPENKTGVYPLGQSDRSLVELELSTDDVGKDFYCRAGNERGLGEAALELRNLGMPTWLILVIMAAVGVVLFIFIAVVGCVLCVDRSYLAEDGDKESQLAADDQPMWMVHELDGQTDDMIPITDFEGGQESADLPSGEPASPGERPEKPVYENSDFETGEKRYQNLGYKVDDAEEDDFE